MTHKNMKARTSKPHVGVNMLTYISARMFCTIAYIMHTKLSTQREQA